MTRKLSLFFISVSFLLSCGGGGKGPAPETRKFPMAEIPVLVENDTDRIEYLVKNFWGPFFKESYPTDSSHVLGVPDSEMEVAVSNYLSLLDRVSMNEAQASVCDLFEKTELKQEEDSTSLFFLRFTELVSKYLYDPNSPLRNEDYYLPFVRGMAASRFTSEDMRAAYRNEAEMCSLNPVGSTAPDFGFQDINGRKHRLYDIKADLTLLFFSNPGCSACKVIMDDLKNAGEFENWIADGRLAIASIYIDRDLDSWREYQPNYPEEWITGYDYNFIIRDDLLYNVRAIPSLYLLDSEKRVLLKDAPTEKAIEQIYLRTQNQ
ncbi:MAG: DUF5106 domain-containing protein [Bacteroidales bacterium]|nr:DUF5106 domain-containing protein [Bacteroidales bacterium]